MAVQKPDLTMGPERARCGLVSITALVRLDARPWFGGALDCAVVGATCLRSALPLTSSRIDDVVGAIPGSTEMGGFFWGTLGRAGFESERRDIFVTQIYRPCSIVP